MRVDGLPPAVRQALLAAVAAAGTERARTKEDAGAEAAPAAPPPAVPAGTALPPPATSVAMLVALSAVETPAERRRRMAERTDKGLTLLEDLRDQLARGEATPEQLQQLAEWIAAAGPPPEDEALAAVAREVELRVRVELAKYDRTA